MQTPIQNAISEAERTISDVCAGRSCLGPCLNRLRRSGVPGPCGCGAPGRRFLLWLWAIASLAVLAVVLSVHAATCSWNGSGYVCNGEGGSYVIVTGGGGDGSGPPIVITNIVGTCTNCVAMSPEYVRNWKSNMTDQLSEQQTKIYKIAYTDVPNIRNALVPYAEKYPVYGGSYVGSTARPNLNVVTNFVYSNNIVGNKPYQVANSVVASEPPFTSETSVNRGFVAGRWMAAYDGAASAFNDVSDAVIQATNDLQGVYQSAVQVSDRLTTLKLFTIPQLSEEECTAQWDGPSSITPDHGSGVVTNQVTGNWCTYEQGQMIISTLQSVDEWLEDKERYLQSLTNWVSVVNNTIIANLNTTYNAIPDVNGLSDTWQNIYLDGQPQPWGYQPTNILARIELLLYGLTGVGTNHTSVVDTEEAQEDGTDNMSDAVSDAVSEADFSRQTEQLTSIKDALLRFCDAFYVENPNLQNARFTPEIRFRLQTTSGEEFDTTFDSVTIPQSQVGTVEAIIETIRVACIVFYYVLMAYCVFSFWRTIAKYVMFAIKWAQELLTSIFAD